MLTAKKFERIVTSVYNIKVLWPYGLQHRLEVHHAAGVDGSDSGSVLVSASLLIPTENAP